MSVLVKDYIQPLDLESIAGVICLSGFMRVFCFRGFAMCESIANRYLGRPDKTEPTEEEIPGMGKCLQVRNILDKETAQRFLDNIEAGVK